MFHSNNQIPSNSNPLQVDSSQAPMQVDPNPNGILVVRDGIQNAGYAQAESIVDFSKRLQDDLQTIGLKIKMHEDNVKFLNSQKTKLEDSILDVQASVGKYHSANEEQSLSQNEKEESIEEILRREKSAAGVLCQLKSRHGAQASSIPMMKGILGIVAALGEVDDDDLSRILSEYLGMETMMGIVCKTYGGLRALELYDDDGCINKSTGLHGLGASIGRPLDSRFLAICLENLRPYSGDFVTNDPQRRLDLRKPRLPNGDIPAGFLGFAVNMIFVETENLLCSTASGLGLRETLFYNLFSRLQVYKTRDEMLRAIPCLSDGAVSLDGGMIRDSGVFSLGHRQDLGVKFQKSAASLTEVFKGSERQIQELKWKKEKVTEDIKREQALLENVKLKFEKKKEEFLKFLTASSSYASQQQTTFAGQSRTTPR